MTYQEILDLINENLASGTEIPAVKHRAVEVALLDYIANNSPKQRDIKYIWADSTYLGDNFETSGLGKNLRLGWALCNGATHSGVATPDLKGRMIMTYGGDFSTLNEIAGSKDAVIGSHRHLNGIANDVQGSFVYGATTIGMPGYATLSIQDEGTGRNYQGITETVGESLVGKNMPPYFVMVAIMKL